MLGPVTGLDPSVVKNLLLRLLPRRRLFPSLLALRALTPWRACVASLGQRRGRHVVSHGRRVLESNRPRFRTILMKSASRRLPANCTNGGLYDLGSPPGSRWLPEISVNSQTPISPFASAIVILSARCHGASRSHRRRTPYTVAGAETRLASQLLHLVR